LQDCILLSLAHYYVTFRIFSHIEASNLILLVLVEVFVGKQSFLTHEVHLLVSPDFDTVIAFLLNFTFELFDDVLQIICIILPFLSGFKEKLPLLVEFFC